MGIPEGRQDRRGTHADGASGAGAPDLRLRQVPSERSRADGRNVGEVAEEAKAEWLARGWVVE